MIRARADAAIRARAQIMQALDLNTRVSRDLTIAALAHAGGSLDDVAGTLGSIDRTIDALCIAVERARVALADEHNATRPVMAEAVAS